MCLGSEAMLLGFDFKFDFILLFEIEMVVILF